MLHLSLRHGTEFLNGQRVAFSSLGEYMEIPWYQRFQLTGNAAKVLAEVTATASEFRPTLVIMQLQFGGYWSAAMLDALRKVCDPGAMLVNWCGDVRGGPEDVPPWATEVSSAFDLMLWSNCSYPEALARSGARCAVGFAVCGAERAIYAPSPLVWRGPGEGGLSFIGAAYESLDKQARWRLMTDLGNAFPGRVHVWGGGWDAHPKVASHGAADHLTCLYIYRRSAVSLSMNLREDLRRYSSGRLTRMLCSGAVTAVRAFDDMEGWGLVHGRNCLVWRDVVELGYLLRDWLRPERDAAREEIRVAAAELGAEHFTWEASARQLWAAVKAARAAGWPKRRTGC